MSGLWSKWVKETEELLKGIRPEVRRRLTELQEEAARRKEEWFRLLLSELGVKLTKEEFNACLNLGSAAEDMFMGVLLGHLMQGWPLSTAIELTCRFLLSPQGYILLALGLKTALETTKEVIEE